MVTGQRRQTVCLIDLRNMSWDKNEVRCRIGDLTKTPSRKSHQEELIVTACSPDRRLCVVKYLQEYVNRTKALRGSGTQLLISWGKPHWAIPRDSLRRRTKLVLQKAGIDLSAFSPHSARAAPTSKMAKFVPLKTILKTVGWRRKCTLATYYQNPSWTQGLWSGSSSLMGKWANGHNLSSLVWSRDTSCYETKIKATTSLPLVSEV